LQRVTSASAHREVGDLEAALLQAAAAVQDALVVRLGGDHVVFLVLEESPNALDGQVVRLWSPREGGGSESLGPGHYRVRLAW
jgi:hypothetical protein